MKALILSIFIVLSVFSFEVENFGLSKEISSLVLNYQESYKIPQVRIIIGNKTKKIYDKSFGENNKNKLYDVASITKVFTALTLLKVMDDNHFSIKDLVAIHLKTYERPSTSFITIEDLLRHLSGLKAGVGNDVWDNDNTQTWKNILAINPSHKYGEFLYSDINYLIAGKIIEKISNLSLDKAIKKYVLKPFHFKKSGYLPYLNQNQCFLTRYGENKECYVHDPTSYKLGGVAGHAGLFFTGDDLSEFAKVFLNNGYSQSEKLISKSHLNLMTKKVSYSNRGVGFDIMSPYSRRPRGDYFSKGISFGHTGYTGTSIWIDPDLNTYMIVLTNSVYSKNMSHTKKGFLDMLLELSNLIGKSRAD